MFFREDRWIGREDLLGKSHIIGPHNPFSTAREWDSETQLYYYRARYYDAGVGRFVTEDPIGFEGGINFYTYVGDDPVNRSDPLGLFSLTLPKGIKERGEYGRWGGAGRGGGEPIDEMDECFRKHDKCYGRRMKEKCPKKGTAREKNCDDALVDCLKRLPSDPRQWKPPAPDPYKAEAFRRYAEKWFGEEKWKEDKCKKECE